MVKVLHLVHAFQTGGAERVILNLIEHGSPRVRNFICSMAEPNDLAAQLSGRDVPLRCLDKKAGNDPLVITRIARLITENGIDLVHSQGWGTYLEGLIAARALVRRRTPFVFAFHGKSLEEARWGIPLRRRLAQRAASWFTDACVAPAAEMAADYARSTGIRRALIRVIHNGIDTDTFRRGPAAAVREEFAIGRGEFVVGFVGRLDPVKDIVGLIEAFSLFLSAYGPVAAGIRLLLVGDGPEMPRGRQLAAALGIRDRIVFAGTRRDIPTCMAAMDVYLQPSFYEGHSLTLLEAMACGLPVVSTAVGGTPEVVRHGRMGYLHAPGDYAGMASSLGELFRRPDLRGAMGEAGRNEVVRAYSVKSMVEGYERLYCELLGITGRPCAA